MKYIIELEDEPRKELFADAGNYYRCKQRPFWFISEDTRDSLTPYTEPDREAIENEVWDFVRFMFHVMDSVDRFECFGSEGLGYANADSVVRDMTYQEAKAKYEAWIADKKQKEASELEEVTALANRIGIHRLYSLVKEIRGE